MNSELDKPSKPDPTALPSQTVPVSKGYFELRLRIYYGWLISLSALAVVIYFFLFISTAFSMKHYETYGSNVETQKEWEDTGCYAILQGHKTGYDFEDWQSKQRWKRLP